MPEGGGGPAYDGMWAMNEVIGKIKWCYYTRFCIKYEVRILYKKINNYYYLQRVWVKIVFKVFYL